MKLTALLALALLACEPPPPAATPPATTYRQAPASLPGPPPAKPPPSTAAKMDKSEEAEARRDKLIATYQELGLIGGVSRPGTMVRVYVGTKFKLASAEDKKLIMSVIWARHHDNGTDGAELLRMVDDRTDGTYGTYSPLFGLDID